MDYTNRKQLLDDIYNRLEKKDEKDIKISILFLVVPAATILGFIIGWLTAGWNWINLLN